MTVSNELIDRLLADYKKPEDLIGENGLLKQLTKRLVERALEAEMAEHLGHGKNEPVANPKGNTRNGKSKKTLKGEFGELPIDIPRDRDGSFEPQIVPKHQTRWTGFEKPEKTPARPLTMVIPLDSGSEPANSRAATSEASSVLYKSSVEA
jgi:putative transposase